MRGKQQIGWGTRGWGATKSNPYNDLKRMANALFIDPARPDGVLGTATAFNAKPANPIQDLSVLPTLGVQWGKVATPTLFKTYTGDVSTQFPFNKITEVTDLLGNRLTRIPKFYIGKQDGNGNKGWFISEFPRQGYYLPMIFWDFDNNTELAFADIGKHVGSLSDDGLRLESKPGKYPLINRTIVQFRDLARANGSGYQQLDIHAVDVLQALFYVWGANLNSQALMQGYTTGQYSASHTATASGTGVNQIVLANANADQYRVGQAISIGASLGSNSVFYGRTITAINVVDGSNKALVFDGAPVNIAIGNIVYNTGYKTGWSAELQTGWAVANDGKSPMAFYGIESLYGDVWQWVDGLNINEGQGWVCKNAAQYASNLFAAPYEQLSYMTGLTEGYATAMGHDPDRPYAAVTSAVGGGSTTFYSDYYYRSAGQRVAVLGGGWFDGVGAGLSCWRLSFSSGAALVYFGGRLLKKPSKAESDLWAEQNGINLNQPQRSNLPANVLMNNMAWTNLDGYRTEVVKGVGSDISYTNLVTNGDFSQGTTGWSGINTTIANESNRLAITATAQFGRAQQTINGLTIGERYSVSVTLEGVGSSNYIFIVGIGGTTTAMTTAGIQRLSFIFTATATSHAIAFGDGRASGWTKFYADDVQFTQLINPAVQALEAKLGRQLSASECDLLFAFTPTSATVKADTRVFLNLDGSDSFGVLNSASAPNPTGTDDFWQLVVFRPEDLTVTRYYGVSRNLDSVATSTIQYGLLISGNAPLRYVFNGVTADVLVTPTTDLQYVLYGRINGERFAVRNSAQVQSSVNATSITSQPNAQFCSRSSSTDGVTKMSLGKGLQGICAMEVRPQGTIDKAKVVATVNKAMKQMYGLGV